VAGENVGKAEFANVKALAVHYVGIEVSGEPHAGVKNHARTDDPRVSYPRTDVAAREFVLPVGWIACRAAAAIAVKSAGRIGPVIPAVPEEEAMLDPDLLIYA